ncbi:MAG: universal stress protein, partial [Chloroflexi bacterium]|nr:universal stress protein [Chloroflexota bacterium]
MLKSFFVPLDGSDTAAQIIPYVSTLARALHAEVMLAAVVPPVEGTAHKEIGTDMESPEYRPPVGDHFTPVQPAPPPAEVTSPPDRLMVEPKIKSEVKAVDRMIDSAYQYLQAQAKAMTDAGIKTLTHVARGDPATMIVKGADAIGAGAVAMSTRRSSALARGILGSVTDRVLHMCGRPLLVMQPAEPGATPRSPEGWPQEIIVPLDGSELSERAVPEAMELAKATGAHMTFMRVETGAGPAWAVGTMPAEEPAGARIERGREGGVREGEGRAGGVREGEGQFGYEYLDRFVDQARGAGITAESQLYSGAAAARIVDLAGEIPGSLVVMTSHGYSGFKRLMIGSVADKVVRASHQPVLVLPPVVIETRIEQGEP